MFNLTGKTALVTGATGGIGGAIAKALHAQGASVVVTGRKEDALKNLVADLGSRAFALAADLSDRAQLDSLLDKAEELAGGLDILV